MPAVAGAVPLAALRRGAAFLVAFGTVLAALGIAGLVADPGLRPKGGSLLLETLVELRLPLPVGADERLLVRTLGLPR